MFPHEYCMAIELRPKSLKDVQGMIQYAKPFYGITEKRKQGKNYPFSYCMEINIPKELKKINTNSQKPFLLYKWLLKFQTVS